MVNFQDDGKGGLGLRGVAFMTVLAVLTALAVLESTLPSFCLSCKIQCQETPVTVLTLSAVSAVSVVTATPLKLKPPFFVILKFQVGIQSTFGSFWSFLTETDQN